MDINQTFGLRIRALRQEKGYSQESLALKSDIDRTYIQSIEKGARNVSLRVIQKLSKGLELTISELLNDI